MPKNLSKEEKAVAKDIEKQLIKASENSVSRDSAVLGEKKAPASKMDKWLDPEYKMSKEEVKEAKQEIRDFYNSDLRQGVRNGRIVANATPEQRERGEEILALQNKVDPISSFASGMLGKIPSLVSGIAQGVTKAAKGIVNAGNSVWINNEQKAAATNALSNAEKDIVKAREEANIQQRNMATQNPVANIAGNLTGTALMYGAANKALEGTAAAESLASTLGERGSNLVLGQAADTLLDTIPTEVENYQNGMRGKDLAIDTLKNQALNAAVNTGAEFIPGLIKSAWNNLNGKNIAQAADAAKSAPISEPISDISKQINPEETAITALANQQKQAAENIENLTKQIPEVPEQSFRDSLSGIIDARNTGRLAEPGSANTDIGQAFIKQIDDLDKEYKQAINLGNAADPEVKRLRSELAQSYGDAVKTVTDVKNPIDTAALGKYQDALDNLENYVKQNAENIPAENPSNLTKYGDKVNEYINGLEMSNDARMGANDRLKDMDNILNRIQSAKSADEVKSLMDEAKAMTGDVDNILQKNAATRTIGKYDFDEPTKNFAEAINGKKIYITPEMKAELNITNVSDLNNSAVFKSNGKIYKPKFTTKAANATPIDSIFPEIDKATGGAISSFMRQNGIDPDVPENLAKGIRDYAAYLKNNKDAGKLQGYTGGIFDEFTDAVQKAGNDRISALNQTVDRITEPANVGVKNTVNSVTSGAEKAPKMKVSKAYTNTLKNSGVMSADEIAENTIPEYFLYEEKKNKQSIAEAIQKRIDEGENFVRNELKKTGYTAVDTDAMMLEWKERCEKARALDLAGEDSSTAWNQANTIFRKIQQESSREGQALQALKKWSRNTPEGMLAEAEHIVNRELGKISEGETIPRLKNVMDKMNTAKNNNLVKKQEKILMKPVSEIKEFTERLKNSLDASEFAGKEEKLKALNEYINDYEDAIKDGDISVIKNAFDSLSRQIENMSKKGLISEVSLKETKDAIANLAKQTKRNRFEFNVDFQRDFLNEAARIQDLEPNSREFKEAYARLGKMVNDEIRRNMALPKKTIQRTTSFLMDNMLGNFRTLITRNAGGNLGLAAMEQTVTRPLAAGIDRLISTKTGRRTQAGLSKEALMDYLSGFKKGLVEEVQDVKSGLHTSRTGEISIGDAIARNTDVFKTDSKNKLLQGLSQVGRFYDNAVAHGLSVGDRPFYEANYKQSLGDLRRLKDKGLLGEEIKKLTDEEFNTLADGIAKLNALTAVYQNDSLMSNALLKFKNAIGELSQGTLGVDILSQFSMPFVKTPANVVDRAIDYSPLGFVRNAIRTANAGGIKNLSFADQQRFVNETARNIIGTGLMTGAGVAAKNGLISGKYSKDKDQKAAQKEAGMQEYALNIPKELTGLEDDIQQDISWIPILGSNSVAAASGVADAQNPELNTVDKALAGLKGGGKAMFDQAFFQGLQRLFGQGDSYDSDEGIVGNMITTVKQGVTQAVPSLARQGAQVADPYQRDLANGNYDLNTIKNTIPGARQTLQPKVNSEGGYVKENQGRNIGMKVLEDMFLPGKITKVHYNNLSKEAMRLQELTGNNYAYMPKASRDEITTESHIPTDEEYTQYQVDRNKTITEVGDKLLKSAVYKAADPEVQESMLQNLYNGIKDYEKSEYTGSEMKTKIGKAYKEGGIEGALKEITIATVMKQYDMKNNATNLKRLQTLGEKGLAAYSKYNKQMENEPDDTKASKAKALKRLSEGEQKILIPEILHSKEDKEMWKTANGNLPQFWKMYDAAAEQAKDKANRKVIEDYKKQVSAEKQLTKAGISLDQGKKQQAELADYGAKDSVESVVAYNNAKKAIPSLTTKEYADYVDDMARGDGIISAGDVMKYANEKHLSKDEVNKYWKAFANSSKIPKLSKNGNWYYR